MKNDWKNKKVMVVGMAKSGISAAKLLLQLGAQVMLYDAKPEEHFQLGDLLSKTENWLGKDPVCCMQKADALVLSPGVPIKQPFLAMAKEAGKPVLSEIELGYQATEADFITITGTNGKTTTTALTGEIFKNSGRKTFVLGNIGIPICDEALQAKKGDVIVAEIAALQLETIDQFHSSAAALLNITPDYLDRFGTMEYYTACKMRIFENQTKNEYAVLNWDDPITRAQSEKIKSHVLWFSVSQPVENGAYLDHECIVWKEDGKEIEICPVDSLKIPGLHNVSNALAAVCLAMAKKVPISVIRETLAAFPGVAHRIEFVREVDGVRYINDSKGTNPDATLKAIAAMKAPTVLILGGYDKHGSFDALFQEFSKEIVSVVLLGATREKLQAAAKKAGFSHVHLADSFEEAVQIAHNIAPKGGNVLLSPACASWDMFQNFEQRGDVFKKIVATF